MLLDLILILVAAVFAILAGAALLGAGAFVVSSLLGRRKARKAALALFAEIAHPGDDLMAVADAVAGPLPDDVCCDLHNRNCEPPSELCCWRCTEGQHPWHADGSECALTGWFEPPTTLGHELVYDADGLVQYGTAMVHTRCRDARRDAATDHICDPCGKVFGRVTA